MPKISIPVELDKISVLKKLIFFLPIALSVSLRFYGYWEKDYNLNEINNLPAFPQNIFDPISYSFWRDISYRLLVYILIQIFGHEPYIARIPTVLFSIFTVPVFYVLFKDRKEIVLVLSFSFILVYMGQQVHPLAFSFFFFLMTWLMLERNNLLLATVFSFIGITSYQIFISYFLMLFVYFFLKTKRKSFLVPPVLFILFGLFHIVLYLFFYLRISEGLEEVFRPKTYISFSLISIIRFLSSDLYDITFIFSFFIFLVGLFIILIKDFTFVISFVAPAFVNYFLAVWYYSYVSVRYFVPLIIVYAFGLSYGIRYISYRFKIPSFPFVLFFLGINLFTYSRYLKSPVSWDFPFFLPEKVCNNHILYILPNPFGSGRGIYSGKIYFISYISYKLMDSNKVFIVEEEKIYTPLLDRGLAFFANDRHKIVSVGKVDFPANICFIITPIFYPQIGGLLEWWKMNVEEIEEQNKALIKKIKHYGVEKVHSSIGFVGFEYEFKSRDEFIDIVNYISRILYPGLSRVKERG